MRFTQLSHIIHTIQERGVAVMHPDIKMHMYIQVFTYQYMLRNHSTRQTAWTPNYMLIRYKTVTDQTIAACVELCVSLHIMTIIIHIEFVAT